MGAMPQRAALAQVVVFFCRLKGQPSLLDNQFATSSRDTGIGGWAHFPRESQMAFRIIIDRHHSHNNYNSKRRSGSPLGL